MPQVPQGSRPGPSIRIAVIGVGGTGCALLPLLATQSFSEITLVDGDTVESVNLSRQLLYTPSDIGSAKVTAAVARMRTANDAVIWKERFNFVDANNAVQLMQGHHLVADCTDDLRVRQLIAHTCKELGIPLVTGSVHERQVQVFTRGPDRHEAAFFAGHPSEEQEGCDMRSIPAEVTTIVASLMSLRISDIVGGGDGLAGIMDLLDIDRGHWMRIMGPSAGELMDTPIAPGRHA